MVIVAVTTLLLLIAIALGVQLAIWRDKDQILAASVT